jgi:drug/metabolite transporter (DMT)-like permease
MPTLTTLQLFLACVAIWSTTWIAITYQLGEVAPQMSVAYRFLLASLLLFAWCAARRLPLRFPLASHGWLALFGIGSFSVSYVFVYYAELYVVSGLVAVGYSASPLLSMLGMRLFFGTPITRRILAASLLGIAGIVLVFLPEIALLRDASATLKGAAYTMLAVVTSVLGAMAAHRIQQARLPMWQSMAWGMLYGALFALALGAAAGKPLHLEATAAYLLSLLYLSVLGSIVAFAGYLTLLQRIGAARAGYIGVMVPIAALLVSAAFEGFRFHPLTVAGIAVSVAGNVLALRKAESRAAG